MSEGDQCKTVHADEGKLTRREKIVIKSNIIQMDKWQRERDKLLEMEWPEDEKAEKVHYARLKQLTQGISRGYKELVSGPAAPYLRDDHKVDWAEYVCPRPLCLIYQYLADYAKTLISCTWKNRCERVADTIEHNSNIFFTS
jgi:hypothetical protein